MITSYSDFLDDLFRVGFSMGGANHCGIYSIITWSWNQAAPYNTPVQWHTGDPDTDPWEWRIRVLEERTDIAYAKLFFKKSGYITKDWYPYFYAVRRGKQSFADVYYSGKISSEAKKLYDILKEQGPIPMHILKTASGMNKPAYKARFDRAMIELQTGLFITMCARQQKISQKGEAYGWYSTVFTTVENFFDAEVFEKAASLTQEAAAKALQEQILKINPNAKEKDMLKFIYG